MLRNAYLDTHKPSGAWSWIARHCGQARCSQSAVMAAATAGLQRQARLGAARPATFNPLSPSSSLPHALRSPCGLSARLVPGGPCPRPVHTAVPQQQQQQRQHTPQQQSQLHQRHVCQAAAAAMESAEPEGKGMGRLASLGVLFVGWYATNIYFNIYQKQILKVFNFPLTCTNLQFLVGAGLAVLFWTTGIVKKPKLDAATLGRIYPLAIIHVVGNVLTNVSLGAVAVSFTHTVKAMEPFFSVVMSAIFLGDIPPIPVLLTLIPIVGGVILASLSEVTFNWTGFTSALLSNITFQSRNVLSKKLMITKGALDNMNMFQILTIMSFFMLLPVTLLFEGVQLCPAAWSSMGMNEAAQQVLMQRLLLAGVCFHGYQQLSYMILGQVTPVTHSIGNCVKRVVVIVASVVAFSHPMSTQNAIGTGIALFGVFLYSQVKRLTGKKDKKAAA